MQIRVFDEESSNGCVLPLEPLVLLLDNGSILNGMISRQDSMPEDDFVFLRHSFSLPCVLLHYIGKQNERTIKR